MDKLQQKIYLIGFMGSGKSYIGKQLAQLLNWEFLDLDNFLERNEGKSIANIFAEGGESLFRELERNYLHATYDFENTVIATGGGAPCFFDNLVWMKANGTTVYLKTPVPFLVNRLKSETAHRPLIAEKTELELSDFIEKKLVDRTAFYENAHIVFEYQTGEETAEELLGSILK